MKLVYCEFINNFEKKKHEKDKRKMWKILKCKKSYEMGFI